MKARNWHMVVVIVMLMGAALACGGSFSSAKISSAKMTADSEGAQETTVFAQDQTFYCIAELANAPEDTKLKAVWVAVEAEGEEPNLEIDQTEMTAGNSSVFTFNLSNDQLWPTGRYKVDLYLNDMLDRTLEFEVR